MNKIARVTRTIPRGTVVGERIGGTPLSEAEHFWKCEACGGWYDMRCSTMRTFAASGGRSGAVMRTYFVALAFRPYSAAIMRPAHLLHKIANAFK